MLRDAVGRLARQGVAPAAYAGGRSAEWVVEDPADDGVELVQDGAVLAVPAAPVDEGFSVGYGG